MKTVNVNECFKKKKLLTVYAAVMDQRTGDKGYGQTDVTSNELGFELVPIQPLITVDIKNFTIYVSRLRKLSKHLM